MTSLQAHHGTSRARRPAFFALFLLLFSLHLSAGGRRRAVSVSPAADELTIAFVDAPGGMVDTGSIAGKTRRTFGIRIGRPSQEAHGHATLRAFLESSDPRYIVMLPLRFPAIRRSIQSWRSCLLFPWPKQKRSY